MRTLRLTTAVLASAAIVMLTGCSAAPRSRADGQRDALLELPVPTQVTLRTARASGLGEIVVDSQGRALYMFAPDASQRVSCVGGCAGIWPPLSLADGQWAAAGPGINPAQLSTLPDPNSGARIVTYFGHPLYRYSGDVTAGSANGQGLFTNGGPWYVLTPSGQPVTTNPAGAS
jgi:predicted lipoprotein with Yx(FWY)xxD motif